MKNLKFTYFAPLFFSLCCFGTHNVAYAQSSTTKDATQLQWEELQDANARINDCYAVWKRVQRIHPIATADPEKQAARVAASMRQQGMSEEQVRELEAIERREAVRSKQGRVINSMLELTRVENSVMSKISHPDPEYRGRSVEFSDGSISLYSQTQVKGQQHSPPDGNLTADPKDVLRRSSSGNEVIRMLLGIPLNQNFGPQNPIISPESAKLKMTSDGTFVVEQEPQGDEKKWAYSTRLTFAKNELYPLSFEVFDTKSVVKDGKTVYQRGDVAMRVVATGHKEYEGGIWFPSKVTVTKPNATIEYSLVSAKFNDAVDPAGLLLPPGLRVADARFGYGPKLAIYEIKDGKLPSDEEVEAMITTDKKAEQSKESAEGVVAPKTKSSLIPFAAGLGLIGFGAVMLLNNDKRKE